MIDLNEFKEGCHRLRGKMMKHSEWDYSCTLPNMGIGVNINGLVQIFDRRHGINDINIMKAEDIKVDEDGLVIASAGSDVAIRVGKKTGDLSVETRVHSELSAGERGQYRKKISEFGSARFTIPEDSVMRLPKDKFSRINWELEQGAHDEPIILTADGQNMVKGTEGDFMRSRHSDEFRATKKPVSVSFHIGDELRKGAKDDYDYYSKPPVCVPVGKACFGRLPLYQLAEEILGDRILDDSNNILKNQIGRAVNLKAYQSVDRDYPGLIRIVGRGPVNYVLYPDTMLGGD